MDSDVLHIVFGDAERLRRALRLASRNDRIVCLYDDLSFGPINPPDPDVRHRWVADTLGFTGWPDTPDGSFPWAETAFGDVQWDDVPALSRTFWTEALATGPRKVLWMSRRCGYEYAGWLEWVWRAGDQPCDVVDLTNAFTQSSPEPELAESPSRLSPEDIERLELLDHARPLTDAARNQARELWDTLRAEDASFRVIKDGQLTSAPITAFDDLLLSDARPHWRKIAMLVAHALISQSDQGLFVASDMVLAARVKKMVEEGRLDFQGSDPFKMRFGEVRLPRPKAQATDGAA